MYIKTKLKFTITKACTTEGLQIEREIRANTQLAASLKIPKTWSKI